MPAFSGNTSNDGLSRLPGVLARHQPHTVIIELGGNDGLRGLSVNRMQENIASMITLVRNADANVILAGIRLPPNYGPRLCRRI